MAGKTMKIRETRIQRAITLIVLICICTTTSALRANEVPKGNSTKKENASRLHSVVDVILGAESQSIKRAEMSLLFEQIKEQATPNHDPKETLVDSQLKALLDRTKPRYGLAVVAAVFSDSPTDTYPRQIAFLSMMDYDRYDITDLCLLAQMYMLVSEEARERNMSYAAPRGREWASTDLMRWRISLLILGILHIGNESPSDVNLQVASSDMKPAEWLTKVVTRAISLDENKGSTVVFNIG